MKHVAIYTRVSTGAQDVKSQKPDLQKHVDNLPPGTDVKWYSDKFSGKSMNRPGWQKLEAAIKRGEVSAVVCWRVDRLGRTCSGLSSLFELLLAKKVNLISLKDGLDLSTPAGRLMAHVLASVAQFETEVRAERVRAGQAVAKKAGKTWGGSKAGVHKTVTNLQLRTVHRLRAEREPISHIAKAVHLSRPTIYAILEK